MPPADPPSTDPPDQTPPERDLARRSGAPVSPWVVIGAIFMLGALAYVVFALL